MKTLQIIVSLIAAFLSQRALAQDLGVAYFAIQASTFPCDEALKVFDSNTPLSTAFLWGTFGTDTRCLEKFMGLHPREKRLVEIHISNEACRRNRRCTETDFLPELSVEQYNRKLAISDPATLDSIRARIREIKEFVSKHANSSLGSSSEFVLSTGLEDNFTDRAYGTMVAAVRSEWPYQVVRSPVGTLKRPSFDQADFIEQHGDRPTFSENQNCIANLDGTDISFPHRESDQSSRVSWEELEKFVEFFGPRCKVTFLWAAPWQGIRGKEFVKPAARSFTIDPRDVTSLKAIRQRYYSARAK